MPPSKALPGTGFRGASISGICAVAGISPGHLYYYFESKEAIVGAIADRVLEKATEHFSRMIDGDNPVAALESVIEQVQARSARGKSMLVLDLFAEAGRGPALAVISYSHSRSMRRLLSSVLHKGQQQGRIDPSMDPDTASTILIGIIDGAKIMAVRDSDLNRRNVVELLYTLITRFLMPTTVDETAAEPGERAE